MLSSFRKSHSLTIKLSAILAGGATALLLGGNAIAATCFVPAGYATIQDAINDATCAVINVSAGTYNENLSILRSLILNGANTGINPNTSSRGSEATISGDPAIIIKAPNVFVDGFTISDPSGSASVGVDVKAAASGAVIRNNIFTNVTGTSTAQALYLEEGPDGAVVSQNLFKNISSPSSAKAVFFGDTASADPSIGVTIEDNVITNIQSTNKGAYGIAVDTGNGHVPNAYMVIQNNTISQLTGGGWVHAIGLEADTPEAVVSGNSIRNLNGPSSDTIGVWLESENVSFATVAMNNNNFNFTKASKVLGVAVDPALSGGTVDGRCNYWGSITGPSGAGHGLGAGVSPMVAFVPWQLSPALSAFCQ